MLKKVFAGIFKPLIMTPSNVQIEKSAAECLGAEKLCGRQLFQSLGNPKSIVAPMVDQSELAFRILTRRYGAQLCYTPMFHARLFGENDKYRHEQFGELDGDPAIDRPLIVQFCANNPDELLKAASHVVGRCDAVDLNLGCPQGIAKRGRYGSFLMEDWDLIHRLIRTLHENLDIPVTAKIRIYEDREKTLQYAKMVLDAGAQFLTVHGRTRNMKGQLTGLADWSMIKYLRDNLPPDTVMIANGNILYHEDTDKCIEETGADAVMSAEGVLYNPAIFNNEEHVIIDNKFPRVDHMIREYLEVVKTTPGLASRKAMKSHFFKILRPFLVKNIDIRNELGPLRKDDLDAYENLVCKIEERVKDIYSSEEKSMDVIIENSGEIQYKDIPYWRCQPYLRVTDSTNKDGKRVIEEHENTETKEELSRKKMMIDTKEALTA